MAYLLFSSLTIIYAGLIGFIVWGIVRSRNSSSSITSFQAISVIVAARNEATNLSGLLEHLMRLDYPTDRYEVIIVNDHSTDDSMEILSPYRDQQQYQIVDFLDEVPLHTGKKAALMRGIAKARFDILAFTDADALPNDQWLKEINLAMDEQTDYVVGLTMLVDRKNKRTFRLKSFERIVYAAICAGGLWWRMPVTSFAGNHAYRKDVFYAAGGFKGIAHLRSGDDDLLLMKMMPRIRKAVFNFSPKMKMLLWDGDNADARHQTNIRRASKFRYFPVWLQSIAVFVFLYWLLFYAQFISWLVVRSYFPLMLLTKTAVELILLTVFLSRIKYLRLLVFYPVQVWLFPIQFIFYASLGSLGKYRWK